nr:MAG TPA: hypothetical protein [Caudoviricetes sp.]
MKKVFGDKCKHPNHICKCGREKSNQNCIRECQYAATSKYNQYNSRKHINAHKSEYVIAESFALGTVLLNILNFGFKTLDFCFQKFKLCFLNLTIDTDGRFGRSVLCKAVENIFLVRHISRWWWSLQQLYDNTIPLHRQESRYFALRYNKHPMGFLSYVLVSQADCRTFPNNASKPFRLSSSLPHPLVLGHGMLAYNHYHSTPSHLSFQLLDWRETV